VEGRVEDAAAMAESGHGNESIQSPELRESPDANNKQGEQQDQEDW